MFRIRRALLAPAAAALVLGMLLVMTTPAQAVDWSPCDAPYYHPTYGQVQKCPLWRGHVPVYQNATANSPIVGYLEVGGWANWFQYQTPSVGYSYGGYHHYWWARTLADGPGYNWGFVPEVFFSGGNDDEPDAGLECVPSYYGTCSGLPG